MSAPRCVSCDRRWFACLCSADSAGAVLMEDLLRQVRDRQFDALRREHDEWMVRSGRAMIDARRFRVAYHTFGSWSNV